jgi:hypothetical protein
LNTRASSLRWSRASWQPGLPDAGHDRDLTRLDDHVIALPRCGRPRGHLRARPWMKDRRWPPDPASPTPEHVTGPQQRTDTSAESQQDRRHTMTQASTGRHEPRGRRHATVVKPPARPGSTAFGKKRPLPTEPFGVALRELARTVTTSRVPTLQTGTDASPPCTSLPPTRCTHTC